MMFSFLPDVANYFSRQCKKFYKINSRQVNLYRNSLSSSKPIKVTGSNQVNLNSLYDPCGSKTVSNNNLNIKINMKSHTSSVFGLTSLPGDQVASASQDTIVKIWNRVTGQLVANLVGHTSRVWTVVYMPNGVLATGAGIFKFKDSANKNTP